MQLRSLVVSGRDRQSGFQAVAEFVHDIDLKDGKFGREETAGVASLLSGVAAANPDDDKRIAQGEPIFNNLYQYFRSKRSR